MVKEYFDVPLAPLNTMAVEARCDRLVEFSAADDLPSVFGTLSGRWNVLGGGSNILLTGDYRGTLLRSTDRGIAPDGALVRVGAGTAWDDFVAWSVRHGLWGVENLSHIPGTVGAAPVQNIGAYGVEAKDAIETVEVFDTESLTTRVMTAAECGFGYRDSVFKRGLRGVITAVTFRLSPTPRPRLDYGDLRARVSEPTLANIREAVVDVRRSKLPDPAETGNAGSFFKNPVVAAEVAERLKTEYPDMPLYDAADGLRKLAAGWLIDRAGWRGRSLGRAGVHAAQALVLVNLGGATGADILALARRIQSDVHARFGVSIETEVNIW
jgi:UDP-N-acetylmuramate dehydrogenase